MLVASPGPFAASVRAPLVALACLALLACGAHAAPVSAEATAGEAARADEARVLAAGPLVRVTLPTEIPFRVDADGFSVRVRVENISAHAVYLDLASPTLLHPTQFGPLTTPQRQVVDERRLDADPLTDADREGLRRARQAGQLTRLASRERLDLYLPFHGTGAQMFVGFATPWVFISLDGHLDALSEQGDVARVSLAWTPARSHTDTDIVLPMPVMLANRDCRRERRVSPRGGSAAWPVVVCAVP